MISVKCLQCGKKFEAKRSTAKFCSDLCRVNYNNKPKGESPLIAVPFKLSEMTADDSLVPFKTVVQATAKKEKWIANIENYCQEVGIVPEDLISVHKSYMVRYSGVAEALKNLPTLTATNNEEVLIIDITPQNKKSNYSINTKKEYKSPPTGLDKTELARWRRENK